jgi:hypothetical protein
MNESGMTPQQIEQKVVQDRARNIPSTVANADPALVDLAETVAQRSGPSGRLIEKKLGEQTNYTWTTTVVVPDDAPFKPGPTQGKAEKAGFTTVSLSFRAPPTGLCRFRPPSRRRDGEV